MASQASSALCSRRARSSRRSAATAYAAESAYSITTFVVVSPTPGTKKVGTHWVWYSPTQTAVTAAAVTTTTPGSHSRGFQCRVGTRASSRNPAAAAMRPASQNVMAFCAVLSDTSGGMPGNDSV